MHERLCGMLGLAWATAALTSASQLFVWQLFEPFPGWFQCVSIFQIRDFLSHQARSSPASFAQLPLGNGRNCRNSWTLVFPKIKSSPCLPLPASSNGSNPVTPTR